MDSFPDARIADLGFFRGGRNNTENYTQLEGPKSSQKWKKKQLQLALEFPRARIVGFTLRVHHAECEVHDGERFG
jgi:hypothetical protein